MANITNLAFCQEKPYNLDMEQNDIPQKEAIGTAPAGEIGAHLAKIILASSALDRAAEKAGAEGVTYPIILDVRRIASSRSRAPAIQEQ